MTTLSQVRIYDNGGKSFDRFTAVFMNAPGAAYNINTGRTRPNCYEALGFSEMPFNPLGFGCHTTATPGRHLGKRISFDALNKDCQQFITQNL